MKIYKEDVTWRIDPEILKSFKMLAITKGKKYGNYIEELMKKEIEFELENENENKD